MHHTFDDHVAEILADEISGFDDHYYDLVELYDGDLDAEILLMELADFVSDLLITRQDDGRLEQCAAAIEEVAALPREGARFVLDCFLAELPAAVLERLRPMLGPRTGALARFLESRRAAARLAQPRSVAGSAASTASMQR